MSLTHLHIVKATPRELTAKASGNKFTLLELQGTMHYKDGGVEVFVYDLWPKKGEPLPQIEKGDYLPVLEVRPSNQTRKLEAQIVDLKPVKL